MSLTAFRTLGRSGLIVSPLALGTMTFGTPRWGSPDQVSESIFNAYVDAGGNFIDTADVYAKGHSEELLGGYIALSSWRDQLVLATKFTFNAESGNPNAGGISKLEQLHDNLDSLDIRLTPEQLRTLDESSALDPAFPYGIFTGEVNRMIFGGATVQGWR